MAQFTYNDFISPNVAPQGAASIGVFDNDGNIVGNIPLGSLQNQGEEPLYKFGLLSDIHVDTTDYNYSSYLNTYPYSDEGEGDFRRALNWLKNHERVDMICACGDLSQNGTTAEFAMPQSVISEVLPESGGIPFYTCTGNHDVKTAGGNGFGNYFLRNLEKTWDGMTGFERSSAFNESFCFSKSIGERNDHFIFFSMYSYSLGSSASPYNNSDIEWLRGKLEAWKNERVFIFTHLFFPDYAGNLGRVNGSGGIYPSGNWLGGTQLNTLLGLLSGYPNTLWFSGHSHWKWDLQRYQDNLNVQQYSTNGAWTVHVPSCALPIDSNYTNLSSETEANRVEKPLESQGGVVYVYEDRIELRGIDFNINASQNGSTTQGYTGDEWLRYLPIAHYTLNTRIVEAGAGEVVEITSDNMYLNRNSDKNYQNIDITTDANGVVSFTFNDASSSIVFHTQEMNSTTQKVRMKCDEVHTYIVNKTSGEETEIPTSQFTKLGWLASYENQTSTYELSPEFDVTYGFALGTAETYNTYQYDDYKTNGANATQLSDMYGVQFNVSSSFITSNTWLSTYGTLGTDYSVKVTMKNLTATCFGEGGDIVTYEMTNIPYADINSMAVGSSKEVIMVNPHRSNGYILGHNGTSAISQGSGFATEQDMMRTAYEVKDNNNYHMVVSKNQDTIEVTDPDTTENVARTFSVSGTFNNTAIAKVTSTTINGYDIYGLATTTLSSTSRTANTTITFNGTEFPRTIYVRLRKSASGATATATVSSGGSGTISAVTNSTTTINTTLSNYTAITMTSNTLVISTTVRRSSNGQNAGWVILVPNNITEQVVTPGKTHTEPSGDPYYTIKSKTGEYGPTGTTGSASWSKTLMKYSVENATSLGTSTDLTSGVSASNNPNFIRFKNPSNSYLNAGGGLSSLKFATGTGEWSVWYLYDIIGNVSGGETTSSYLQKSNFETNTSKGSPSVDTMIQDLDNGYVAVSFNTTSQGFWVTIPNGGTTLQVVDLRVYSGLNTTSGTTITLPANVGFYEGNNHSGTERYQIATGFQPSTTESGSNGRVQFQTSSSYTGGNITIVMKVKFN